MTFGTLVRAWFESLPKKGINEHRALLILERRLGACAPEEVTPQRVDELLPEVQKHLRHHVREAVNAALGVEPEREDDDEESAPTPWGMSLSQCAARLGMSRERVREIERSALAKMRRTLEAQGVALTDLLPTSEPFGPGPQ